MTESPTNSTVAAVVVTFNRKELLCQCLDGILAQYRPVEALFVIDNASTDGTCELIQERYAGSVRYTRLPENVGGAGGFHHGMKLAFERGFDYIWIMDDDVRPEPGCLQALACASSDASIVAPLHITPTGEVASQNAVKGRQRATSVKTLVDLLAITPESIEVKDITFEGPLIPRSVITAVGLPREDFFIFWDDNEYGMRIASRGLGPLLCIPGAKMTKLLPNSSKSERLWRRYYFWRNGLHVMRSYENSSWKRWELDIRYFLAYIKGLCLRRPDIGPFNIRFEAWLDSFATPMKSRYLPSPPAKVRK